MNIFHIIHVIAGFWLAIVNFMPIMPAASLAANNIIIGIIVALYNAYYLFARKNVNVQQS